MNIPLELIIVIVLPILVFLISLVVERVLELFDQLIVSNVFFWWRSEPAPVPPAPLDKLIGDLLDRFRGRGIPEINATLIPPSPGEIYQLYYEDYLRQLGYYIIKNGYFLSRKRLWQRLLRWAINDENFILPYSLVENWLAHREGVSILPDDTEGVKFARRLVDDEKFAKKVLNCIAQDHTEHGFQKSSFQQPPQEHPQPCQGVPSGEQLTEKLLLWADYCHLRNQRTYQAFSSLKGQVYLVFGTGLGILIVMLLPWTLFEGILQIVADPPPPPNNRLRWIFGGGSGSLAPVSHGFTRRIANAGLRLFRRTR